MASSTVNAAQLTEQQVQHILVQPLWPTSPQVPPSVLAMSTAQLSSYQRWTRRTDGPLLVLALIFLAVFVLPLYQPNLPGWAGALVDVLDVVVWVAFAVDYLVRLGLSPSRIDFVRRHTPDLLTFAEGAVAALEAALFTEETD